MIILCTPVDGFRRVPQLNGQVYPYFRGRFPCHERHAAADRASAEYVRVGRTKCMRLVYSSQQWPVGRCPMLRLLGCAHAREAYGELPLAARECVKDYRRRSRAIGIGERQNSPRRRDRDRDAAEHSMRLWHRLSTAPSAFARRFGWRWGRGRKRFPGDFGLLHVAGAAQVGSLFVAEHLEAILHDLDEPFEGDLALVRGAAERGRHGPGEGAVRLDAVSVFVGVLVFLTGLDDERHERSAAGGGCR